MKTIFKILSISVFTLMILQSCTYVVPVDEEIIPPPEEGFSFADDVQPIFVTLNCTSCHGGNSPSKGLNLEADVAYTNIVPSLIDSDNPDQSVIYTKALTPHMGKSYTQNQAATILSWIEDGAKDN
jgi:hypothetical protein